MKTEKWDEIFILVFCYDQHMSAMLLGITFQFQQVQNNLTQNIQSYRVQKSSVLTERSANRPAPLIE